MKRPTRYLHVTATSGEFETRLMKEARTAAASGLFDEVHIIAKKGTGDDHLPLFSTPGRNIVMQRITVTRGIPGMGFLLWHLKAWMAALAVRPKVLSIHHVTLLPYGVVAKFLTGAKLVYDAHELETESASAAARPKLKKLARLLEKSLLRFVDHAVVVGEGIARWYRERYPSLPVTAIHNYPKASSPGVRENTLRRRHGIPTEKALFIYQGVLEENRGVPLLLETFSRGLVPNGVLVLMGYGAMEPAIREAASRCENIKLQPAVRPDEIVAYTSSADVGLCVFDAPCLSYALCSPNKVFEYLQAGLPIVVARPLIEMTRLIEERGLGVAADLNPDSVATACIAAMSGRANTTAAIQNAAAEFTWENEERRLTDVYASLLA